MRRHYCSPAVVGGGLLSLYSVTKLKESLSLLRSPDRVTAKGLAQISGRIYFHVKSHWCKCLYLHTRHMYYALANRKSRESLIFCSSKVMKELKFWDTNVDALNGKKLFDQP